MPYMPQGMPLPKPSGDDAPFWEATRKHELVIQRCSKCGTFRHLPAVACYNCQSFDHEWVRVSGKGVIFSYINIFHPVHPAVKERVPYNVVLVELPDAGNVRLIGNIVDTPFEALYVGMPVEVFFEDIDEQTTLPQWKRGKD